MLSFLKESRENKSHAHVVPFAAFLILNFLMGIKGIEWAHPSAPWWREWPEQWMYPLQTLIVGGILAFYWKHYQLKFTKAVLLGALMGVVGIGLWLLPTTLYDRFDFSEDTVGIWEYFGVMPRTDGFNPNDVVPEFGVAGYWVSLILRLLRAVVVVALVEEIFWRGFIMRFVLDPDGNYWKKPFGVHHWKGYVSTTLLFMFIHQPVDYCGAFFFGSLMYWVAVRTKSLLACIVMHGVANLLMGIYAIQFGKYGLW